MPPWTGLLRLCAALAVVCGARASRLAAADPADAVSLRLFVAIERLEGRLRASPGPWPQDEQAVRDALLDAEIVVTASVWEGSPCRVGLATLVEACAAIARSPFSAFLRQHALMTLRMIAVGGRLDGDGLRHIVSACDLAAAQPDLSLRGVVEVFDAVSRSIAADAAAVRDMVRILANWVKDVDLQSHGTEGPQLVAAILDTIARASTRLADDAEAYVGVVSAVRSIAEAIGRVAGYSAARGLVVNLLVRFVSLVHAEQVLVEALGAFEACVADEWVAEADSSAELLRVVAEQVSYAYLGRVVGLCASATRSNKALEAVQRRLAVEDFGGKWEKLSLLARILSIQEQRQVFVHCSFALHMLLDLFPPEAPSLAVLALSGPPLPSELAMHIYDYLPPRPEETVTSEIVEICARRARRQLSSAATVLHAACLRPRRIGLAAAKSFSALAREAGGELRESIGPWELVQVGRCLQGTLAAGGVAPGLFRDLDVAGAGRIAAELLDGAALVVGPWPLERRRAALAALCALAGGLHLLCGEIIAPSPLLASH